MIFVVPPREDLFEETISSWIEMAVDSEEQHRQEELEKRLAPRARHAQKVAGRKHRHVARPASSQRTGDDRDTALMESAIDLVPHDRGATHQARVSDPNDPHADIHQPVHHGHRQDASPKASPASETAPAPQRTDPSSPQDAPVRQFRQDDASGYPQQFARDCPRLVVQRCDHDGVTMLFEPHWLNHEGFRASMPQMCAFSGEADHRDLMARPMVFADQSQGQIRNVEAVENAHQRHIGDATAPLDLVHAMGLLDKMPKPFDRMMPYYVCPRHLGRSLSCSTFKDPTGRCVCRVVVPEASVALRWLVHVNGLCGAEYHQLCHDVQLMSQDAWRDLTDACRQRLSSWCHLTAREMLKLYLSDGDFATHDAGLAGLAVTDHRIIYHKYHHHGEVPLDSDALIQAKRDGDMVKLTLFKGNQRTRMVRLHERDLPRLVDVLKAQGRLQVRIADPSLLDG